MVRINGCKDEVHKESFGGGAPENFTFAPIIPPAKQARGRLLERGRAYYKGWGGGGSLIE